jgi:predicted secreted protein
MSAQKAYGAALQIGDGALADTPTYTNVAGLKSIGDWVITAETADVTTHQSTGGFREKLPTGIFMVEDLEMVLAYDDTEATHANSAGGIMHALLNETKLAWKINMADSGSTVWTFEAYVTSAGTVIDTGESELQQNVTLTITGQPTLS